MSERPHQGSGEPAHQEGLLEARAAAELVSRAVELAQVVWQLWRKRCSGAGGGSSGSCVAHCAYVTQSTSMRLAGPGCLQAAAGSDEEFTDAVQESGSSSEGEEDGEEHSSGCGLSASARAAAAAVGREGHEGGASTRGQASPALRAAAAAVEAAAAAGVAFEGRDWDRQMISLAAIAEAHLQAGKVGGSGWARAGAGAGGTGEGGEAGDICSRARLKLCSVVHALCLPAAAGQSHQ